MEITNNRINKNIEETIRFSMHSEKCGFYDKNVIGFEIVYTKKRKKIVPKNL